jgi:hypothetical protein
MTQYLKFWPCDWFPRQPHIWGGMRAKTGLACFFICTWFRVSRTSNQRDMIMSTNRKYGRHSDLLTAQRDALAQCWKGYRGARPESSWRNTWIHPFCLHRQSAYACSDSAPDPNLLRGVKLWIPRTDWLPSLFTWSYVVIDPRDYHGNHTLCLEAFWLVTCQVAAKIWIQIFQTSLACRNNHRRNGVRLRK